MVAKRLEIPCYDQEIIRKLVEEKGFAKEYAEEYTAKQSKQFVIKLFKKKMSYENIKDVTNLPDEILKELQESIK